MNQPQHSASRSRVRNQTPWFRQLTMAGSLRVPAAALSFWVVKALSTAFGESTSDYLVRTIHPVPAVLLGFVCFVAALLVQLRMRRYLAVTYWLSVAMVGVFGTMAADVLHVGLGVPYIGGSLLYGFALTVVFLAWWRVEGTLSVHSIDTSRRELFYWAAVVSTFALGTAVGDLTAITFKLGYAWSIVIFAALILVPGIGYRWFHWNGIAAFWVAYVLTRPLGASVADYLGKPTTDGGAGWGSGVVTIGLALIIVACVAYLAVTRRDVQTPVAGQG